MFEQQINWFSLQNGDYVSLPVRDDGVIRSLVFPGLWLKVTAMLSNQMPEVLTVLQAGLDSAEHRAFVQRLAQSANLLEQ